MNKKEKNIMLILDSFESDLKERLQETKDEVERVKYYEKFQMKGIDFNDIFITTEKDVDGNISYNVYSGNASNKLMTVNSKGEIDMIPELKGFLGDIDLNQEIEKNDLEKGRLRGISEKTNPKEMENKLKKEETKDEGQKPEEQIEQDLDEGEDLEIGYYRKIEDDNFDRRTNTDSSKYDEKGLAYSKKLNAFILVGQKDGKFERAEGFEIAQPTMKTIISIDEKGETIEKKVPHALMKTNDDNKEVAITIEQYGYIETESVDRLPCNQRIAIQHQENGETKEGKTEETLMKTLAAEGKTGVHEWVHRNENKFDKMEQYEPSKNEDVEEELQNDGMSIDENDYIPNTKITWRQFANECGFRGNGSLEKAKEVFDNQKLKAGNKTNEELVNDIIDDVQETSAGPNKR